LSAWYQARWQHGHADPAPVPLLDTIDRALHALIGLPGDEPQRQALRALVGIRCNLFPAAPPPAGGGVA
jgi:hypothetical protein